MSSIRKFNRKHASPEQKFKREYKRANRIADGVIQRAQAYADSKSKDIEWLFTGISNIAIHYVLRKYERLSEAKVAEYVKGYEHLSEVIVNGYATFYDLYQQISLTDSDMLGWSDWVYPVHSVDLMCYQLESKSDSKTKRDIENNIKRVHLIQQAESIYAVHEIMVIATLQDYLHFTLKRIKRVITKLHGLEYITPAKVYEMVDWLQKYGPQYEEEAINALRINEGLWSQALKTPDMMMLFDLKDGQKYIKALKEAGMRKVC